MHVTYFELRGLCYLACTGLVNPAPPPPPTPPSTLCRQVYGFKKFQGRNELQRIVITHISAPMILINKRELATYTCSYESQSAWGVDLFVYFKIIKIVKSIKTRELVPPWKNAQ